MSQSAYRGRHRSRRSLPIGSALVGSGLLLPASLTMATVLLNGGTETSMSLTAAPRLADPLASDSVEADAVLDADPSGALAAREGAVRAIEDRSSRSANRTVAAAVAAENTRRATVEAALSQDSVVDVSLTGDDAGIGTAGGGAAGQVDPSAKGVPGSHAWVRPLDGGYVLTSGYGYRWGSLHPAQDFAVAVGTPVKAMSSGKIIFAGWQGGYGNKVEIQYWDGTISWYCHNSVLKVAQGQIVASGQVVALSGNTGHSTGPHVHVEIHTTKDQTTSPLPWMRARGISV
ncbi:MAG: M23 family metallopeptidase [Dermatophilaceae bacterium]